VRNRLGAFAQAKQHYEESLHLFQGLDVHWGVAQAMNGLIGVAYAREDYAEVKRLCEITIPLYEKMKAHSQTLEVIREIYALVLQREAVE
jgi:hypothetical protein